MLSYNINVSRDEHKVNNIYFYMLSWFTYYRVCSAFINELPASLTRRTFRTIRQNKN